MNARAAATPIALVAIATGAAAYAYCVDRRTVSDADRAARRRDVFPSFRVDQVKRVELEHGNEELVLEREVDAGASESTAWIMTSPRHEQAEGAAVDMLLRELELATRVRNVSAAGNLGLDTPRARGHVVVGSLQYRFSVGADAARPEGGAYMSVDGEGTFVVPRSLKVQLLRGADAYRDRSLVPLGVDDIARFDVRTAGSRGFALERTGSAFFVAGARLRASRTAVDHLFAALADARAESFLDDAEADRATQTGVEATVIPRDPNRQGVELRIGGACPGQPDDVVVVRTLSIGRSRASACTPKSLIEALSASPESFVDEAPLFARADEIEHIRLESLERGGYVVDLARKKNGWHERAPDDRDIDPDESDSANALALALASARGEGAYVGPPNEPLAIRARATITRTGGALDEIVELGAPAPDGFVPTRRLDDGAILRLPRAGARHFEPHPVALRAREMWRPPFDAGSVVAVDNGCTPTSERLDLRDGIWAMRSPTGFAPDPLSIADLTRAIARTKVDAWIAETDDGTFGFDRSGSCALTLVLGDVADSGTRRVSLVFGAEGEGGVYAHTLGDSAVFVASRVLRDVAAHPAIDRSHLRVDTATSKSVTLVRGGDRLVLERNGDRLVRQGREGDAGDEDKLEAALEGFHAQSALHIGPSPSDEGMDRPTLQIIAKGGAVDAGLRETRIIVGARARIDSADLYFVRSSSVNATFAVPRAAVAAILDAF